ncbi:MAG TPA: hypothetical protein VFU02_13380, partial [Polyangiaceae bacterium]|nr:hypothetical protein [Polyangiaceae bacterium]
MRRTVCTSNGGFAVQGVFELQLESEFWRYVELYQQQPYCALLDSARDPETLGRYSFITGEVVRVFEARLSPRSRSQGHAELTWLDFGEGSGPSPTEPRKEQREGDP